MVCSCSNVNLGDNSLTGSIPESVAALTGLSYLNLGVNGLSGTLPTALGALSGLRCAALFSLLVVVAAVVVVLPPIASCW